MWTFIVANGVHDSSQEHRPDDDGGSEGEIQPRHQRQTNIKWQLLDIVHVNALGTLNLNLFFVAKFLREPSGTLIWEG